MKEEGSRNEAGVSAKKTKTRTNFLGRILGYTDSYYEAQEKAKQEKEEAERLAAEAKEVEEKCKAAYDACKKAREDARAMADAGDAEE